MTAQTETTDPIRDLHEFALNAHILMRMRNGKAKDPQLMWELASGAAAAWAAHRLLVRLTEVDPDRVAAFAAELSDELEMPEQADDPVEVAQHMGFDAQTWIDNEFARRKTRAEAPPADRAAILREAAKAVRFLPTPDDCGEMDSYDGAWESGQDAAVAELRRMADEAQSAAKEAS